MLQKEFIKIKENYGVEEWHCSLHSIGNVLLLQERLGLYLFCAGLIDCVFIFCKSSCLDTIWKAVEKMLVS